MKINFIRPNMFGGKSGDAMQPLVFSLLKSLTPKEIETVLWDERIEDIPEELDGEIVAITVETFTAKRAYYYGDKFRKQGKYVVMGGYHPTFLPDEALEHSDSVFVGEGEKTWGEFLEDFKRGNTKRVYSSKNDVCIENIEFDSSIFKGKKYNKLIPIQFGRGCIYNCEYCSIAAFYGKSSKFRCVDKVMEEIEKNRSEYLFITDDNLLLNKSKSMELFRELKGRGVKWASQISIDAAKDDELLKLMKESGCMALIIGFETLNGENLKQMGKGVNLKSDYETAIKKIHSHGIMIYGTFIFGYDGDTKESFDRTLEFTIKNKLSMANFNPLMVMPGTMLYDRMEKENRLIYKKWWIDESYKYGDTMFLPKNMTPQELKEGCYRARVEFNSYKNIIYRFSNRDANMKNPLIYFGLNMINRKEIKSKQGVILGE